MNDQAKLIAFVNDQHMTKQQVLKLFNIDDLQDLSRGIMQIVEDRSGKRQEIYLELLAINNYDLSKDWFQSIYEDELAQRKENKQDFTPNSVSHLVSLITGNPKGKIYEATAGNGGMVIADWWNRCQQHHFPFMHFPADNMIECWELSARSIPILLLNLSIRGIMGVVYHGDVLEQTIRAKYILLNRNNDTLGFSEIIKDKDLNLKLYEV